MLISTLELQVTERQFRNGAQTQVSESRPSLWAPWPWNLNFTRLYLPLLTVPSGAGLVLPIYGFPHSSVDKESACNAGEPSLIPEMGRSSGEGIGYPLIHGLPLWLS